ncbi:hypothetical protein KRR26_06295 [Corallococcus sp. M34]|uniref:CsgG/HfaB family protein n=1 Tax=Citreicoccus inhibens TaxID=2849499 RepID=UPI001C217517|nr:CsgG/HfaB family protein [Citreicoccus inhibens]MBU8895206.1 hypothetical protein [Citreicoccus inhibens]
MPDSSSTSPPRVRGGPLHAEGVAATSEREPGRGVHDGTLQVEAIDPANPRPSRGSGSTALLVAAGLALPSVAAFLLRPTPPEPAPQASPAHALPLPEPAPGAPREPAPVPTGPVRVCVLRFRSLGEDARLPPLEEALAEAVVTDVGQQPGLRIIERGQLDLDLREQDFSNGPRVDPETRARLGRIAGAEVVIIGSVQRSGDVLRAAARFVHVESGEVLDSVRVEAPAQAPFALQDVLAERVRTLLPALIPRLRP